MPSILELEVLVFDLARLRAATTRRRCRHCPKTQTDNLVTAMYIHDSASRHGLQALMSQERQLFPREQYERETGSQAHGHLRTKKITQVEEEVEGKMDKFNQRIHKKGPPNKRLQEKHKMPVAHVNRPCKCCVVCSQNRRHRAVSPEGPRKRPVLMHRYPYRC